MEKCLIYALESRRRVKEQLKKIGGMEFYDVHFSYIDNETLEEKFVSLPEQGGGSLIPESPMNPGTMHTVMPGTSGHLGLYRLELQATAGNGKLSVSGSGTDSRSKEAIKIGYDYFKANMSRVSSIAKVTDHDYHLHIVEMQSTGPTNNITLCSFITFCSGLMGRPIQSQMIILGDMSLGGTIEKASNLAETLQVGFDAGAKRILIPMSSVGDIPSIPDELFAKFQTSFYSDPVDAVYKALGVE
ncbi:S16 family serine protease [Desulfobacter vibrioformis]|uniref:S16 family serine protease n=1 Tax=Desulfobacter vibrioformis TaxID=34031 RepID=UPI000B01AFF8|nr:S16 family serine protease [Desulfobacter vibrioformis]